jgi:hypothetical protein
MLRRSLSFVVCCSLLISGGLMSMGTDAATKKVDAEKQKKLELLRGRVTANEKAFEAWVANIDKDVAANICIRNLKKTFESLSETVKGTLSAYFEKRYNIFWYRYSKRLISMGGMADSIDEEKKYVSEDMQKILADKALSVKSKHAKDFDSAICASILDSKIGSNIIDIFLGICEKSIQQKIEIETIDLHTVCGGADAVVNHFLLAFNDSIKIGIQSMANELAKHYEIDFEALGLEEPKE